MEQLLYQNILHLPFLGIFGHSKLRYYGKFLNPLLSNLGWGHLYMHMGFNYCAQIKKVLSNVPEHEDNIAKHVTKYLRKNFPKLRQMVSNSWSFLLSQIKVPLGSWSDRL